MLTKPIGHLDEHLVFSFGRTGATGVQTPGEVDKGLSLVLFSEVDQATAEGVQEGSSLAAQIQKEDFIAFSLSNFKRFLIAFGGKPSLRKQWWTELAQYPLA